MSLTNCRCDKCRRACRRAPGVMTPDEARRYIVDRGPRGLMVDYWIERDGLTLYLTPATDNMQDGGRAPNIFEMVGLAKGVCVFFSSTERCGLHHTDYKPRECRESFMCTGEGPCNNDVIEEWRDNPDARLLIDEWAALSGLDLRSMTEDMF